MSKAGYFTIVEADISKIGKNTGKKEIIFLLETSLFELICVRLSLNSFLNTNLNQKYPDIETIDPTIIPIINNNPMSAPIMADAAIGPGVGGTKTCAEYKPVAKHIDRKMIFFFVIFDKSLTIEDISMNAASQKTGIDIINPITFKLMGIFLIPRYDMKVLTIFLDVPVSFKNFPSSVPVIIIGPIKITIL